ncbi:MAG: hypothetical protein ACWGQW_04435, partial [bacterium]
EPRQLADGQQVVAVEIHGEPDQTRGRPSDMPEEPTRARTRAARARCESPIRRDKSYDSPSVSQR